MEVSVEHFEDRDDTIGYEYVYDVYTFRDGERTLSVRRYRKEPEASFEDNWTELRTVLDLVPLAVAHMKTEGVTTMKAYDPQTGGIRLLKVAAEYAKRLGYITAEESARLKTL
jgi:hypothetical protein